MLVEDGFNHTYTIGRTLITQPKQQDAAVWLATLKDQIAKILVVGQQHSTFVERLGEDVCIIGLRHLFALVKE